MDYVGPIEAIVPGVQGRVLGVLARTEAELTMRTVARLAGVSVNRASTTLGRLVTLGVVERREAGSAALVALVRDNEAARTVLALADLRELVLGRLRAEAGAIRPPPSSLVIFGSFVTGGTRAGSDIDVAAVAPQGVGLDDNAWLESLTRWSDRAHRIVGNPVDLVHATRNELPELVGRRGSVWEEAAHDGVLLAGSALLELAGAG